MKSKSSVVWITGASSGIGKATAAAFVQCGAWVIISARTSENIFSLTKDLQSKGYKCLPIPCDVSKSEEVSEAVLKIEKAFGPVDVLINNAGASVFKSFVDSSIEDFDNVISTNLRGAFLCTKAVLPNMIARKDGLIVMINSVTSKYEFTNSSIYAASKSGLKGMTDALRKEVRSHGVRIVTIYPGATNTNIWHQSVRDKYADRMMKPDDVADVIIDIWKKPKHIMIEEVLMRPVGGDL